VLKILDATVTVLGNLQFCIVKHCDV